MAKKAKKVEPSKKAAQKQKQQAIEDKTFGLKNKNKSKKVQQHVQSIQKNIMNSGDPKLRKMEEQRKKAKEEAKARKKAMKDEQDALFGAALMAVSKKTTTSTNKYKVEAKGRDADDGKDKKSTSRAMKMMYQMDAKEMADKLMEDPNYVPTLEDEVEMQRQKKVAELKGKGTPVTPETFAAWKERKRKAKADAARKTVEAEFKKKKGGKGLSILSGRDLYEYKKDLFAKVDEEEEAETQDLVKPAASTTVDQIADNINQDLFLQEEGDDDDLDDLDDD